MSRTLIETTNLAVELAPRPIEPSWIIEGNPVAQSCVLSTSADGLASTMVWECSEGRFNWYYDFDETVLILEGSIVLESDSDASDPLRCGRRRLLQGRRACQMACRRPGPEAGLLPQDPAGLARLCAAGVPQAQEDSGAGRRPPGRKPDGLRLAQVRRV